MPTGYTANIKDGISFEQFAMQCARAFGACIMMRDEPSSTPIPDEFKPSTHYSDWAARARTELAEIERLTPAQCEDRARLQYDERVTSRLEYEADKEAQRKAYFAMLEQVRAWIPPTPDHVNMKEFMIEQIESSIKFDCSHYDTDAIALKTGEEWKLDRVADLRRDIANYDKHQEEENERARQRTEWVRALRASL